jgi:MFS family permease
MAEKNTERAAAGGPATPSAFPDIVRSLRHRNFRLFFSGQLISLVGTWMQNIAQSWLVYDMTKSSLLLGTVAFCGQIPVFLLAPVGGMVADRWHRRHIVIATQTTSMILAFVLSILTLSGRVRVWEVIVLAALLGAVNAFDMPTRQAFLVEMVGREDLMNAIALNSSMFNGARIIGPAIAGVLVATIGEGWCFFANGASYIAVIIGLLMMRIERLPVQAELASSFERVAEGFRFVRDTAPIRAVLLLLGLVSVAAMPYVVLMPIFAARVLHGNARTLGVLMGATGIGALASALMLATRTGVRGLDRVLVLACAGFGASLILFSFSRWYVLSVLLLLPVGFFMMTQMTASNTLIQSMVPDRLRGRTMAAHAMMFMGLAPIGSLLSGVLAQRIGAPWTVAIGGAGAIVGVAVFARALPNFQAEARRLISEQGMPGTEPEEDVTTRAVI